MSIWKKRPGRGIISLMFAFSQHSKAWLPRRIGSRALLELETLSVATYNVWFDAFEAERRRCALFDILEAEAPDVIALEEVTAPFLSALLACAWVRAEYEISRTRLEPDARYDVVMLSRLPTAHFAPHALTSRMGRKLHLLTLDTQCGPLAIAGVHLESMREMTPTRLTQIEECLPVLNESTSAIWMGDFNAAPGSDEDARLRTSFRDVWDELERGPGYTRDTSRNRMLRKLKDDRHQRIDRILVRSRCLRPTTVRLLGTDAIANSNGEVFPSDHFGLIAELACSE